MQVRGPITRRWSGFLDRLLVIRWRTEPRQASRGATRRYSAVWSGIKVPAEIGKNGGYRESRLAAMIRPRNTMPASVPMSTSNRCHQGRF